MPHLLAPRALRCLLPLALLLLCSCTEVVRSGDKSLWTFAPWVGVLVVLGSLSGIAGSFAWMAYRDRWTGLAGILLFVIAGVIAGPGMFSDFCEVTPDRFHLRTGFWFAPNEHIVSFQDVTSMHMVTGRSGRRSSTYLLSQMPQGQDKTPIGDLMRHGALDDILTMARRRNIPLSR